jgi:hypothetical protein
MVADHQGGGDQGGIKTWQLALLIRRLILPRLVGLVRLMVADDAACGRTQDAMVSGDMAGDSADHGTLKTAFGIG